MPYTLAKFFLWGLLMALGGGLVGWFLRSLKARAEVATASAVAVAPDELERLRGRLANLEPVVAERDRLRMELADVRGSSAGALGFASEAAASIVPDDAAADDVPADPSPDDTTTAVPPATAEAVDEPDEPPLDLDAAASVLGKKIKLDDLTVVEGVGPKISVLCDGIGVTTWRQLAGTDVAELQTMLDAGGPRFRMHKPETWPRQAELLADGRWAEFKQVTDDLVGGS